MDTVDRNYVEALINRAMVEAKVAREVAESFALVGTVERLTWALEFLDAARVKLPASRRERT